MFLLFSNAFAHPLIDEAEKHLNKRYIYSATGPNNFDCSGFVYYCVKEVYAFEIKRTAREQGYDEDYTKIISIDKLKIGDLVFFNTVRDKDLCDHAGIYIGNNQFIHCSSSKGKVIISEIEGSYYENLFSWGRRLIEDD